jgi:hypothetical protein
MRTHPSRIKTSLLLQMPFRLSSAISSGLECDDRQRSSTATRAGLTERYSQQLPMRTNAAVKIGGD